MKKHTYILIFFGILGVLFVIGASLIAGGFLYRTITKSGTSVAFAAHPPELDREAGILVAGVELKSPAEKAGIVRGDILQKVNDTSVNNLGELQDFLSEIDEGEEIEFTVIHGDEIKILDAEFDNADSLTHLGIKSCEPGFQIHEMFSDLQFEESKGALILEVAPDSSAENSGLEKGDFIVSVDGDEIGTGNNLSEVITGYHPGDQITILVEKHDGDMKELEIKLDEHPEDLSKAYLGVQYEQFRMPMFKGDIPPFDRALPPRGYTPFENKMPFEFPEDMKFGALVLEVSPDSPAEGANIKKGDVITEFNEKPIKTPQDLVDKIGELEPGDEITLTVFREMDDEDITIEVELDEHPQESGKAFLGVHLAGISRSNKFEHKHLPFDLDDYFQFDEDFSEEDLPFNFHFDLPFDIPFEDLLDKINPGENA